MQQSSERTYRITGFMMTGHIELVHQTCELKMRMSSERANVPVHALNGPQISLHMLILAFKLRGEGPRPAICERRICRVLCECRMPRVDNMRWKHKAVTCKCTKARGRAEHKHIHKVTRSVIRIFRQMMTSMFHLDA